MNARTRSRCFFTARATAVAFAFSPAARAQAQPLPFREYIFEEGSGGTTAGTHNGSASAIYGAHFVAETPQGCGQFALDFDGGNDRVKVPGRPPGGTRTIEAWIKPDGTSGTHVIWAEIDSILSLPSEPTFQDEIVGSRLAVVNGHLLFEVGLAGYTINSSSVTGGNIVPGVWQHVAAVANGSELRLYVNGVDTGVSASATFQDDICQGSPNTSGCPKTTPWIGCDDGVANFFDGKMDDVRYYTVALTPLQLANGHFDPTPPPPCGCDADLNNDGHVDNSDVSFLASQLFMNRCRVQFRRSGADINCDGAIDYCDASALNCVMSHGTNCCAPCGGCCHDGVCAEATQSNCLATGGIYLGNGIVCPNVNAAIIDEGGGQIFTHVVGPPVDCTPAAKPTLHASVAACNPNGPFFDSWRSKPGPTMCQKFGVSGSPAIPANFFEPGSEAFSGTVCLQGLSLNDPLYGDADTVVRRSGDPLDPCNLSTGFGSVNLRVVALRLVSIAPLQVVTNGQPVAWNMAVGLSTVPAPEGQLFAFRSHCNGGTFSSSLNVQPRLTFTKVSDPSLVRVLDTGEAGVPYTTFNSNSNQPWVFEVPAASATNLDACTKFHPGFDDRAQASCVDCNNNQIRDRCEIEQDPSKDCNRNGILDACDVSTGYSVDANHDGIPDECQLTSDTENTNGAPPHLGLEAVAPNPWRESSRLWFSLAVPGRVTLTVYDVAGRKVATLVDGARSIGRQAVAWSARDDSGQLVPAGVYYISLVAGGQVRNAKIVVVR